MSQPRAEAEPAADRVSTLTLSRVSDEDLDRLAEDLLGLLLVPYRPPSAEGRQEAPRSPRSDGGSFRHPLPQVLGLAEPPPAKAPAAAPGLHWYCVWVAPGCSELVAVHGGATAWAGIEERLPGQRYRYSDGTRLRGWRDLGGGERRRLEYLDAWVAYFAERSHHGCPRTCRVYVWP